MSHSHELTQQRLLAALKRLQEKGAAHFTQICRCLAAKGLLEGHALRDAMVDLVGIHVLAKNDADPANPWHGAYGRTHIIRHHEGKVGGAPIGWQTELDMDVFHRIHLHGGDEAELRHRLVKLRIGDTE